MVLALGPAALAQNDDPSQNAASVPAAPPGPQPGANSFVESQARAMIVAKGFENVSPLVNDRQGIWRGTASKGRETFNVTVDYKGHVDAQ
jgi:hypothetical protein